MDLDGSQSAQSDPARRSPRRRGVVRGAWAVLRVLGFALLVGIGSSAGRAAHADAPGVRLPKGEFAGESWDVIAHLDSGHFVVAQAALSNLGPGDHHAAVLGYLIDPSGGVQRFKRSEPAGQWTLTAGRRGLDLRSIALTPFGPDRRFVVSKDELGIELALRNSGAPGTARSSGACSFELLEAAAPATAKIRLAAGGEPIASQARVALTHRWSASLEADCVLRRIEVFVLERDLGVYFSEITTPRGDVSRWLVAERAGRVVFAGDPGDATVRWAEGKGFAPPERAHFAVAGLSGSFSFEPAFARVDPTERLPAAVQWLVGTRTKPQLSWMRAPFELRDAGGTIAGLAMAKLTYSNPLPRGRIPARVAAHSEE